MLSKADQITLARTKEQVAALQRLSDDDRERLDRVAEILDLYDERVGPSELEARPEKRTLN